MIHRQTTNDLITWYVISMLFLSCQVISAQPTGPWNNPLLMTTSADGQQFDLPVIFQDSAGVPSLIRWKGDTLVAAFQWFREPKPSPTWDRVAVKFSYDNGETFTDSNGNGGWDSDMGVSGAGGSWVGTGCQRGRTSVPARPVIPTTACCKRSSSASPSAGAVILPVG